MDKLLSIVIPTRNRYKYLKKCVEILETIESDEIEITISDNSDSNEEILLFFEKNNFKNINYFYTKKRMSQTENSEFAVSKSNGRYVCFIGDDDLVLPSIIDLARKMEASGFDSCLFDIPKYYWPDLVNNIKGHEYLSYKKPTFKVQSINAKKVLEKQIKLGCQNISPLARVYHGLVSKELLNEVKDKFGSFFPGPSPDMANAVAVSYLAKKTIKVCFSPIISGYGNNSAGGMGQQGKHAGPLKGNFQLSNDIEDNWNAKIPKIWLSSTIYAFSAYSSMSRLQNDKMIKKMNYGAVYFEVKRFKQYKHLVHNCSPNFKDVLGEFKYLIYKALKKVFAKDKNIRCYDYLSIEDAFLFLNEINSPLFVDKLFNGVLYEK